MRIDNTILAEADIDTTSLAQAGIDNAIRYIYIDTIKVAKYRSGALHVCTHVCFIHRKTSMVINVSNQMK